MLADEKRTTFAEIERHVGISNGQIRRWDNASPKAENLKKVADYFNVSTDYLLGRTDNPDIDQTQASKALTVAAHIDDDVTDEQMENILNYIDFITSKHKKG